MKRLCVFVLVILVFNFTFGCKRAAETGLNPGDAAPLLSLADLNQKAKSLADFQGKIVLLNFWASWCATCVEEMPSLQRLYDSFKDRDFVVVAVGVDDTAQALGAFSARFKLSFPVLVGSGDEVRKKFGITGYPETFILDRQGRVLLFADPAEHIPATRIIGPRQWDSAYALKNFDALLGAAPISKH